MAKKMTRSQRKRMAKPTIKYRGFFAYPSSDRTQCDIIETAAKHVNQDTSLGIDILTWPALSRHRVMANIVQAIAEREFTIADISGLNVNVLFEVGLALGMRKNIVLVSQGNSTQSWLSDLKNLHILSGLNTTRYQNSSDLVACTVKESEFFPDGPTIDRFVTPSGGSLQSAGVLFLKGSTNHEYTRIIMDELAQAFPASQIIVDDWNEDMAQPLSWYLAQLEQRPAIVTLFVPTDWDNSVAANARFSVICGIAIAMKKRVLMVGLPGYESPFDCQDILKTPKRSADVARIVSDFIQQCERAQGDSTILQLTPTLRLTSAGPNYREKTDKYGQELVLLDLAVGSGFIVELNNTIAEHEENHLPTYFVQTGQFRRMLSTPQALIVGSKGSGKTASLFMLRDQLGQDSRNIVCVIKPPDHKMSRFLSELSQLGDASGHATHVAETSWKLIIYCEVLSSIYTLLTENRVPASLSRVEREFVEFFEANAKVLKAAFEERLEIAAEWFEESGSNPSNFARFMQERLLNNAAHHLSQIAGKKRIVILVDNLDKTWSISHDLGLGTTMILSLLGIHRRIERELCEGTSMSLMVFLRRNIFDQILREAREPDKLLSDRIELVWDEPKMLLDVIVQRFKAASNKHMCQDVDPWDTFFCRTIEGNTPQQWLLERSLCRPRNIIHLVRRAIELALNRSHSMIREDDLRDASRDYSEFALEQLIAEYQAEYKWISDTVRSFAGLSSRLTRAELMDHLRRLRSDTELPESRRRVMEILVGTGFLGIDFGNTGIRYAYGIQEARALQGVVHGIGAATPKAFVINPAFRDGLSVVDPDPGDANGGIASNLRESVRLVSLTLIEAKARLDPGYRSWASKG